MTVEKVDSGCGSVNGSGVEKKNGDGSTNLIWSKRGHGTKRQKSYPELSLHKPVASEKAIATAFCNKECGD
jgi:hypothetical protein